jgi:hypothetical protein
MAIDNDYSPIDKYQLCGEKIVQSEPEAANQRSVTTAQRETRHPDGTDRASYRGDAKRIGYSQNVHRTRTSGYFRSAMVGTQDHPIHLL